MVSFKDVFVQWSGQILQFGNSCFSRTIDLTHGYPVTKSLINSAGKELSENHKTSCDCSFICLDCRNGENMEEYKLEHFNSYIVESSIFEDEHVVIEFSFKNYFNNTLYKREIFVYPNLAGHGVRNSITTPVLPQVYYSSREQRMGGNKRYSEAMLESCVDNILPINELKPAQSVEFLGRTDYVDDLVKVHQLTDEDRFITGNLLYCQNSQDLGFLYLQEAQPSTERRDYEQHDFRVADGTIFSCNWGIAPSDIDLNQEFQGVRNALLLYTNKQERDNVLKDYLAKRFPVREQNYAITVNPWGSGGFYERINPEFINSEIVAAAQCGADYYQIDDGWQQGQDLYQLIINRNIDLSFWDISKTRMAGSLDSQVATAKEVGIKLALWVAPTHNIKFRDYKEFSAILMDYYKKYGFSLIKVDGVSMRDYESERNLERILHDVREQSNGEVYFNLDTTNGLRAGYYMFLEYGNIFLQNRYTYAEWGIGYHPEKTLKTVWELLHYMRPESLQIEIPSQEQVNSKFYDKMDRVSPSCYPFEYWIAITMFANPLIWQAPSIISAESRAVLNELMSIHKSIRNKLFKNHVYPIGAEPNSGGLSGFYGDGGYLLVFRDHYCDIDSQELSGAFNEIPFNSCKLVYGEGSATIDANKFKATLPNKYSFALFELV